KSKPNVYLSHEISNKRNAWAITPILIDILNQLIKPQIKWFVVCEANSIVNLKKLLSSLENENELIEGYYGFPLYDRDATIIHHFAFFHNPSIFHFPFLKAGVAFSIPLLHRLVDRLLPSATPPFKAPTEFSIDASHELALFIWNIDKNLNLKTVPYFCSHYGSECAIYARDENIFCGNPISLDKVLFAVKTCEKYHKERLPIILGTWAQFTIHLRVFSDVRDDAIPTVSTNVPNYERGHCEKSLKILGMVLDEITKNTTLKNVEWIVMTDDDTLLSTSSLTEYLGCFNKNEYIYLGERYGFDLFSEDNGYNYITGGGGIVFNLKTVRKIVESCSCPSPSSPDDMIIAACLKQLGIEPIHSTLFHQARPKDYPSIVLNKNSISFHKFWQIDPIEEYDKRFKRKDKEYYVIDRNLISDYNFLKQDCISEQNHEENVMKKEEFNRIEL
ncbi:CLUMA_CG000021, isoform A, partial [Clunio marinus]